MNATEIAFNLGATVISLLVMVWGTYALRWLQGKINAQHLDLAREYAAEAVLMVEQLWQSGQIQKDERYLQACEFLETKVPFLAQHEIEAFIEGAVARMKIETASWDKPEEVA